MILKLRGCVAEKLVVSIQTEKERRMKETIKKVPGYAFKVVKEFLSSYI